MGDMGNRKSKGISVVGESRQVNSNKVPVVSRNHIRIGSGLDPDQIRMKLVSQIRIFGSKTAKKTTCFRGAQDGEGQSAPCGRILPYYLTDMVHFSKDDIILTFFRKLFILQDVQYVEDASCDINFKRRYTKSSRQLKRIIFILGTFGHQQRRLLVANTRGF